MKITKLLRLGSAFLLSLSSLLVLSTPLVHATGGGTFTWNGGDASAGTWSTADNWVGGTAPQSGDVSDTIIIDNSANFSHGSTDNIASLSLTSLQFTNDSTSDLNEIELADPLTITSSISQATSDTATTDFIENNATPQTITLGGAVTVTSSDGGLNLGNAGQIDTIALGGNTLTFTDRGDSNANDVSIYDNITGNGAVVYNGRSTNYQLYGTNTYSGTTQVTAVNLPIITTNDNAFGTSAITIGTAGEISFDYDTSTTLSNPITISGTTSDSPVTSLDFTTLGSGVSIAVPHITLNGQTRFSNDGSGNLTVDLAGITANGNCVQYIGGSSGAQDGPSNGFINGPGNCVVSSGGSSSTPTPTTPAPKAPNTGFELVTAHPLLTVAVSTVAALSLVVIARRLKPAVSK